ncbi:uncharacterized protein BO66DRAFT_82622 [Aspergillus aculeatinus CBS 121060]|uniref:Uncharacterized protein n=1 Tax=Aspergillus aculeatinus CBS 121060 TaxID=1448322 RepID=A0ACD1HAI3_9EURO|nr:hypothetical protein BO66DRAFT_82622 [Aspergillus aculeatinus CBS 121060]RAH70557.1 hypothetical protein BO66DRAFT_82622 [Aspergillus aculeatinus CBS 121060]
MLTISKVTRYMLTITGAAGLRLMAAGFWFPLFQSYRLADAKSSAHYLLSNGKVSWSTGNLVSHGLSVGAACMRGGAYPQLSGSCALFDHQSGGARRLNITTRH